MPPRRRRTRREPERPQSPDSVEHDPTDVVIIEERDIIAELAATNQQLSAWLDNDGARDNARKRLRPSQFDEPEHNNCNTSAGSVSASQQRTVKIEIEVTFRVKRGDGVQRDQPVSKVYRAFIN